jgi:hypothetical protein
MRFALNFKRNFMEKIISLLKEAWEFNQLTIKGYGWQSNVDCKTKHKVYDYYSKKEKNIIKVFEILQDNKVEGIKNYGLKDGVVYFDFENGKQISFHFPHYNIDYVKNEKYVEISVNRDKSIENRINFIKRKFKERKIVESLYSAMKQNLRIKFLRSGWKRIILKDYNGQWNGIVSITNPLA